jgi:hypothetical protein
MTPRPKAPRCIRQTISYETISYETISHQTISHQTISNGLAAASAPLSP